MPEENEKKCLSVLLSCPTNWNLAKEMLNAECKMLNEGVRFADIIENHFRRKYLNSAFRILHSAFWLQPDKFQFAGSLS